jgi:hypothetical protein
MGWTTLRRNDGLTVAQGLPVAGRFRWPLLLATEGLLLAAAATSVNIPPLVAQLFRALLTF